MGGDHQNGMLPTMKVRHIIAILEKNGFVLDRQEGSHRQYEGFVGQQRKLVTVAGKSNDDVSRGTLASIRRQSGLPRRHFR